MPAPIFPQNTIAVIWDFDNTLIPGSMQQPLFHEFGVDDGIFWREVNALGESYERMGVNVNQSTAYLNHILTYVANGRFDGLNNRKLEELGKNIMFYPGLPAFFPSLTNLVLDNQEFRLHGVTVENYIISTGLIRMIRGSDIAEFVDNIWGCEFIEDVLQPGFSPDASQAKLIADSSSIKQIGYALDDTTKTRAVFEINKGTNKHPDIDVNATIPHDNRRIPFENMIYVADGPSDIPVFSLVNQYGGRTFAVYHPESERLFKQVYDLQRQGRIQNFGPANYEIGSPTYLWLSQTVKDIATRIVEERTTALRATVQPPPRHIPSALPQKHSPSKN